MARTDAGQKEGRRTVKSFFVFDVESIGLHGDAFAVAGGVYLENGAPQWEFRMSFPRFIARGTDSNRDWAEKNIPPLEVTHECSLSMHSQFWANWLKAKSEGAEMAVECGWPVEANFLSACVANEPGTRTWEGPYPLHEIASIMLAAGMDPMAEYERRPSELPKHDPLADARLSARLLAEALEKLGGCP